MQEIWKDVKGYENHYQVSNHGRVRTLKSWGGNNSRILSQTNTYRNKVSINRNQVYVDILVANAFVENPKSCRFVKHLDGNMYNNVASNLVWIPATQSEMKTQIAKHNAGKKLNTFHIDGEIVIVKLSNSEKEMICDLQDWEMLKKYTWQITPYDYVQAYCNGRYEKIHNLILPRKKGYIADHINRNRLDNRRCNLRYATVHANNINHKKFKSNSTGHTGVSQLKNGKYYAYIYVNRKCINLGQYSTLAMAIEARKLGEERYHLPIIMNETLNAF